ncbi:MAG: hypothetical protein JSV65_02655 [Armatimonadota bacterium]|nr:MAG: hypothetical protein JSV65_02655 [Armatimonadota bacterium]
MTIRIAAVAAILLSAAAAVADTYGIDVDAQPQRLGADGDQPCAITVRLTDSLGAPAPDGTEVTFVTTLGTVEPQIALTAAGMARAELSSPAPGTAEVSIIVGGQREVVAVEFTGAAAKAPAPSEPAPMVRVAGRYVAYSADYDCITASDHARAEHGKLVVEAGNIQYEVSRGVLKAQHAVRVTSGAATLEGERACYHVSRCRGVLLSAKDSIERIAFSADDLSVTEAAPAGGADFLPTDTGDTNTWVVARDAVVFPRDRIQFTDATLYVGEKRVFSLPYYVAPLRGQRSLLNQIFSLSSTGGLNLDLPFYYAANETHVGSLHIRRRARGSYGYGRSGWSLGVEEQYLLTPRSKGTLALDDITESTRSVRLDHQVEFDAGSRLNMGFNYYRYNPDYPGALTARAFYNRRLSDADLNIIALGSSIGGMSSWSVDSNMHWRDRPVGRTGFAYDVSGTLGYGGGQYGYGGGLLAGCGVGLAPPAWRIGNSTSATLDLFQQFTWAQIGGQRTTFDARAIVRQGLGSLGSATLAYNYNLSRGGYYSSYGREQVSLNAYLGKGLDWRASGYASYSLDRKSLFASGSVSYALPIERPAVGAGPWRVDLRGSFARFGTAESVNSRIAVGRAVGDYEALLCYSPTASYGYGSYGYGYGRGKTLWVEFAPRGF